MTQFLELFKNNIYQFFIGGFLSFIAYLAKLALDSYKKTQQAKQEQIQNESTEQQLIKEGVLALLRFRINRLSTVIKDKGYMTTDQKYDLMDLYSAYESLGGNSRTHLIYEDLMTRFTIKDCEKS